ncbi:MAG TPA: beta-N-acetylhexosaminidase [Vicinamibacteria bacterium]|nr:beta-N-acetylhexosaminidase [Vicinamibacteria bacterium]
MKESLRRAGQRVMVGFEGMEPSADVRVLIRQYGVSHVILFARNVDGPEQLAGLVRELQGIARDAGHDLPLMIGVDQEGGRVARLRKPWTVWPSMRALGRLASESHAERVGRGLADELAPCGIRWDFAPVVDVDSNPKNPVIGDRSLGGDPALVGRLGAALIRGLQGGGVAACAKHFPGHGDTDVDSHHDLPVVTHSPSRLEEVELPPFRAAVEAGVVSVMTCHVLVPELDETLPATLSPRIVEPLLRRGMSYDGVVVTDDMEMKAVTKGWGAGEAAVLAALAGCDLVTVSKTPEAQVESVEALVRAQESERIAVKAMESACARLRRLKERFLLPHHDPDPKQARLAAVSSDRVRLAEEIAERSGLPAPA